MRTVSVVLCGVSLFSSIVGAASQMKDNTITVTGKATVQWEPDICYITLYVKGDGILMVDAVKKATQTVGEIGKAISEKHKEVKKFEVTEVGLGEKQQQVWRSDQEDQAPRPEAIKRIRIEIPPKPSLAHEVIDTAIRSGAILKLSSRVQYTGRIDSAVVYGLVDASALKADARKKATEDAKKRAEETAGLVHKKVGKVVSIGSAASWPSTIVYNMQRRDFPVEHIGTNPEMIEVSDSVTIIFELLD